MKTIKNKIKTPPPSAFDLDPAEQEMLDSVERGEWKTVPNVFRVKLQAREAAAEYLTQTKSTKTHEKQKDPIMAKRNIGQELLEGIQAIKKTKAILLNKMP